MNGDEEDDNKNSQTGSGELSKFAYSDDVSTERTACFGMLTCTDDSRI